MRHLTLPNACKLVVLVAAMGIGFAPRATAAANFSPVPQADAFTDSYARICPQFLTKYCVLTRSGHRETVETNPCFARERGWRILHAGSCRR
jgi:hypothetical protein